MPDAYSFTMRTAPEFFDAAFSANPEARAVAFFDTDVSYAAVNARATAVARWLSHQGIGRADRVVVQLQNVPQFAILALAIWRVGAVLVPVNPMYKRDELAHAMSDSGAVLFIGAAQSAAEARAACALAGLERQAFIDEFALQSRNDARLFVTPSAESGDATLEAILVGEGDESAVVSVDVQPQDPALICYTSGTTGKPKGIVHTTAGYLTGVTATSKLVFDLKEDDLHFCTADCGWITGHSYIVYGPLSNGATVLMYEGAPDTPDKDRFWRIIEKHRATILYTAPTAIRAFMKWGNEYPERCDLSSLRLLGSVGEPINPEAWMWYEEVIGGKRCPVVDTWWQTETGAIMITALPGITHTKPGSATHPFPGIRIRVLDEAGEGPIVTGPQDEAGKVNSGFLVIDRPWPSMTRGIFGDPERFKKTYWSKFDGKYFAGDGVAKDQDGYLWLLGRVDDIMLVAGHNISTMEVESALVSHPSVAEAAVIGKDHELKGQAIAAFVILRGGHDVSPDALKKHVAEKIGPIARPDDVFITAELPKTRSGKIMRRLLRDVAEGRALGDTTTLADPAVVAALKDKYEGQES